MALKFFLTYIGIFLACSVTLAVLVKQLAEGFAADGKKPFVYGAFSSLVASGAAYLSTFITNRLFTVFWILAGIYLLFGIIHIAFVHNKYFRANNQNIGKIILAEMIFGFSIIFFSIVIFSTLRYFISEDKSFLFYPMMMSTITFFIPFLFFQTFEAAYNIPQALFKTWQYPLDKQIDVPEEKPGEKQLVIGFQIAKNTTDKHKTYFRAKAPDGMTLGEFYYHFLNDYNEAQSETPIAYANDTEAHKWWFRRKPKWYQAQRVLDPEISVRENGIKENSVIICERLKPPLQS